MAEPLLEVKDLKVSFRTEDGLVRAVDGISFTVDEGEVVGIVGESGSGKSVTMMSVMRLITDPNVIYEGEIVYKGRNLMGLSQDAMREVRGEEIAMIFQDPMTSLNPVYTIGWQIEEQLNEHYDLKKGQARRRASELLAQVGIPRPEQRIDDYPHQFSGGMRQRVMIALALSCNPDLLIADEPTTALDVTIQAQILELIKNLKRDFGSAVVLITHDLGVVADIADRILVMYAGRIVEEGNKEQIFYDPQHPYTWGLLGSIARLDRAEQPPRVRVLRVVEDLLLVPLLDDPAGVHDEDPVGDVGDDAEVVRDQDDRRAEVALQVLDQLQDLSLDRHVEGRGRLVCDQQVRVAGQRQRDHHALPHPARELMRVVVDPLFRPRDSDLRQQVDRSPARLALLQVVVRVELLLDLPADRVHRVQRGHRVLEDHRDLLAADLAHRVLREAHQVAALVDDLALVDHVRIGDQPHHRQHRDALA